MRKTQPEVPIGFRILSGFHASVFESIHSHSSKTARVLLVGGLLDTAKLTAMFKPGTSNNMRYPLLYIQNVFVFVSSSILEQSLDHRRFETRVIQNFDAMPVRHFAQVPMLASAQMRNPHGN